MDGFQHGYAIPAAQVKHLAFFSFLFRYQVLESKRMGMGDITYMNEIADAGAIAGRIIISIYLHLRQLSHCCLGNGRNQVGRPANGKFTDDSGRMCANRIEIPQQNSVVIILDLENSLMICSPICLVYP